MGGVMLSRDRLILVRHGESTWNAEERLQGQLDPPLSERGREQSRALAAMLDGLPDERVVCSDLGRARQTAEILGLRPARFDPRWREIDVGEWGGRVAAEIDALGPELTNWRGGPRKAVDGESWHDFSLRVAGAADELVAAGGPWVVVCHGGCIRAAVAHVTGADPLRLGSPPNASATVFELGAQPRLLVYGSLPDGGLPTGLY
jgi:glucosyl-3-phosphoglycerate phosphatase